MQGVLTLLFSYVSIAFAAPSSEWRGRSIYQVSASYADIAAVHEAWEEMESRQRSNQDTDKADRDFHLRIAMATHNSALVSVVHDLWDRGRGAVWKRMEHHFQTPQLRAAAVRDHQVILAALDAGDARAARIAMRQHLERVDRDFNRGWELLKERESANRPTPADGPKPPSAAKPAPVPARRAATPRKRSSTRSTP